MRGFAGRRDSTHAPIRDGLRARGWKVLDLGDAGNNVPDLCAGVHGRTYLIECKAPGKSECPGQAKTRQEWRGGPWIVAECIEDVLDVENAAIQGRRSP
jgi:hypothetical protein